MDPSSSSRRTILTALGAGIAGTVIARPLSLVGTSAQSLTDADILTFALNLEYLEAEFYSVATTGKYLEVGDTSGIGDIGRTTGGRKVKFENPDLARLAEEIGEDEKEHVRLLRSALGTGKVAKPAINLDALGIGFASETEFLSPRPRLRGRRRLRLPGRREAHPEPRLPRRRRRNPRHRGLPRGPHPEPRRLQGGFQ